MKHHGGVAVVGALTLWGLGTAFLIFPMFKLPGFFYRATTILGTVELVTLLVHSYGSEGCGPDGCGLVTAAAGAIASQDVPALAALLYVLAVGHGLRARTHQT